MSSSPCLLPLLLSFLVTLWNSPFVTPLNNEEEAIALLSFKHSIIEDPLGSLSNWTNSSQDPCSWNGVTCKDQSVTSISIPNKKLSGILSPALGSLPHLRHVNLRNNRLSGNLPPDLFKPEGIQSLVLYGNSFSGPLPSEVGTLQFLQTLDLSQNSLNGPLPGSLVQCKRLRNLDLSKNNFSGYLPDRFGKSLTLMEKLDLSFNGFMGSIPSDLGYLANLEETLDLSHNLFNGSIPASLGNLPEKVYIDLTHNNLSGPIPQTGALMNRGPTAFIGNPGLCGPPLKTLCSSTDGPTGTGSFPYLPSNYPPEDGGGAAGHGGGMSRAAVIAIVIGDVVGICVIGLVFSYCYSRMCRGDRSGGVAAEGGRCDKGSRGRKECFCFRKDESETLSENAEHDDLVALDTHVAFDLDELLKASAFVLGKSGIGIVYKVVLEDGLTLAVRRLGEGGSQRLKEFQTEVEAIGKLRHRNVVTLKAYYWSADEKLLIYEFLPNGNLSAAVHGKPGLSASSPLPWPVRLKIIKGTARGLLYLHDYSPKKYVHGDLKPSNVLLGHDMEPKIADFGLGRLANIAGSGSPISSALDMAAPASGYQAPESLKAGKPSQKWDVYSYGVILLELLTGRPPLVAVGGTEVGLVQWMQLCIEEKKPVSEVLDPSLALHADKEDEMIAVLKVAMACTPSSPERRLSMRQVVDALERV